MGECKSIHLGSVRTSCIKSKYDRVDLGLTALPVATQVPSEIYMVPTGSMMRYPIVFVVMLLLACLKNLPEFEQLNMEQSFVLVQSFVMVIIATDVKDSHVPSTVCVRNTSMINGVQTQTKIYQLCMEHLMIT